MLHVLLRWGCQHYLTDRNEPFRYIEITVMISVQASRHLSSDQPLSLLGVHLERHVRDRVSNLQLDGRESHDEILDSLSQLERPIDGCKTGHHRLGRPLERPGDAHVETFGQVTVAANRRLTWLSR